MTTRKPPLDGIKVLDLTRVLAGPWCTQNLADLGADVIKVERPISGDDTRAWGPPFAKDKEGNNTTEAAYYLCANRNKRSIALDIASPKGAAIVQELAKSCDIFIENFKVGGLKKYGLDYESLKAINPKLIYCSITGFGQTGPMAKDPGYDFIIQGMGGLMSITGERDDLPGGGPQKAGVAVTDLMTGMYATVAILGALHERNHSGLGQYLDIALLDSHVALIANQNLNYMTSGSPPTRYGNAHLNIVPYQVFPASDGHLIVAVGNDKQYRSFCQAIQHPELAQDERFITNPSRLAHRDTLVSILTDILKQNTRDYWLEKLNEAEVPCGPINNIKQVFEMPQVQARGLWKNIPHPTAGTVPTVASPMLFSETPVQYLKHPPLLGEHTEEILKEFNLQNFFTD